MHSNAAGIRLIAHDTLGSTNAEALALARAGEHGPLWVTAGRQTAGRGRRGNAWTSEPGNLYASLLLTDTVPAGRAPELCFVAALALHDAVSFFLIPPPKREGRIAEGDAGWGLQLKWPNDLLIDGAKFAGILIEAESVQGRPPAVAIGIGVNCAHHPADVPYPATDLAACGIAVTPEALLERLSAAMQARLDQWQGGFAATRADWLARAAGLGGDIVVRLSDRELAGKFETLDRMGRLMLRLPAGTLEAITVGEVFAPSLNNPPLKGEGRTAEGSPGRGHVSEVLTPTRLATLADLPLPGGGRSTE
jgi:BirA family transcriptional regulator, biotin operon repressor / biotin---[acetyl-CoA-carboxylase] ligase